MKNPKFDFFEEEGVMVVEDLYDESDPTITVTNGIETVLYEIERVVENMPDIVIYKDTDGMWDGVVHENCEFLAFAPLRATSKKEAIQKAKKTWGLK